MQLRRWALRAFGAGMATITKITVSVRRPAQRVGDGPLLVDMRSAGGGIRGSVRRGKGSPIPWRLADRQQVWNREAPRLLRIMRRERKSRFLSGGGYPIPLTEGGSPRLWGRLRRSAWTRVQGNRLLFGWKAGYAWKLNAGWRLAKAVDFGVPGRRGRVHLSAGTNVAARRYAEGSVQTWYNALQGRLARHRGRWSKYR